LQNGLAKLNATADDLQGIESIKANAIAAFAHVTDRSWLSWGAVLLPHLQKEVEDEAAAAAEAKRVEEEENERRKREKLEEDERKQREAKAREAAEAKKRAEEETEREAAKQTAERQRKTADLDDKFLNDEISPDEYTAALGALAAEYDAPDTSLPVEDEPPAPGGTQNTNDDDSNTKVPHPQPRKLPKQTLPF
jgi:Skp family chaperone for outer membrane proteins